jgi:hypothetical protein
MPRVTNRFSSHQRNVRPHGNVRFVSLFLNRDLRFVDVSMTLCWHRTLATESKLLPKGFLTNGKRFIYVRTYTLLTNVLKVNKWHARFLVSPIRVSLFNYFIFAPRKKELSV